MPARLPVPIRSRPISGTSSASVPAARRRSAPGSPRSPPPPRSPFSPTTLAPSSGPRRDAVQCALLRCGNRPTDPPPPLRPAQRNQPHSAAFASRGMLSFRPPTPRPLLGRPRSRHTPRSTVEADPTARSFRESLAPSSAPRQANAATIPLRPTGRSRARRRLQAWRDIRQEKGPLRASHNLGRRHLTVPEDAPRTSSSPATHYGTSRRRSCAPTINGASLVTGRVSTARIGNS